MPRYDCSEIAQSSRLVRSQNSIASSNTNPGFAISSGGSAVLYARDGLHSVPIGGGASTLLNESAPVPVGDVAEFVVSPDGERSSISASDDTNRTMSAATSSATCSRALWADAVQP